MVRFPRSSGRQRRAATLNLPGAAAQKSLSYSLPFVVSSIPEL